MAEEPNLQANPESAFFGQLCVIYWESQYQRVARRLGQAKGVTELLSYELLWTIRRGPLTRYDTVSSRTCNRDRAKPLGNQTGSSPQILLVPLSNIAQRRDPRKAFRD